MRPLRASAVVDYEDDQVAVIRHDARTLPLEDGTVDLIVTSPPYFALRSYRDDGEHYAGQIGSEDTPDQFLEALDECMVEWGRVLKPSGSVWINLGDKYSQRTQTRRSSHQPGIFPDKFPEFAESWKERREAGAVRMPKDNVIGDGFIPEKSLMGLPWRFAIRQIDAGWILRAEVVWDKPNGLPESVTDRVRRSHEQWFHFVKEPRYFSGIDEIRGPSLPASVKRAEHGTANRRVSPRQDATDDGWRANGGMQGRESTISLNPLGRLPGSVWTIPSEPLLIPDDTRTLLDLPDHFAAFPQEWPRRIITGWSPTGICTLCGEGRRPVVEYGDAVDFGEPIEQRRRDPSPEDTEAIARFIREHREAAGLSRRQVDDSCGTVTACSWWEGRPRGIQLPPPPIWRLLKDILSLSDIWDHTMLDTVFRPSGIGEFVGGLDRHKSAAAMVTQRSPSKTLTGYVCGCPTPDAPTRPSLVVDPFGGTGTVAGVAKTLGRYGISNDLSESYNRLAIWRITQSGHFTKTEQRTWADRQGQLI